MASPPESAGVMLCSKCTEDNNLKVPAPCHLHRESIKDGDTTQLWQIRRFLYEETLSGDSIRLLQLEPGHDDQPIQCNLIVKSLDSNPVYTALSYAWGDQTIKHEISCDGQPLHIGENLHSALWQIRQDNRADALWVDAVCINQKNTTEKTAQVRKMRQIYEAAKLVVCWLGKQETSDEDGFALMRDIYAQFGDRSIFGLMNPSFETTKELGLTKGLGLSGMDDLRWKALCKILYRPYFFRIWIIQEIIVARDCIIQCGTHLIDRAVIFAIGATIEQFYYVKEKIDVNISLILDNTDSTTNAGGGPNSTAPLIQGLPIVYSVRDLWALKSMIDTGVELKICQLLMNSRAFKATEPRDRIYALIGLCSDVSDTFIDYDKHIEDVQIEIAKLCMLNLESWGSMIFSYVDREHHSDHLPSWVPDWISGGPIQCPLAGSYYAYRVGTAPVPNWELLSNNQISLNGTIFDQVSTVIHETPYVTSIPILRTMRAFANYCREMEDWEDSCWDLAKALGKYPTGQNTFEAYWRTLIFNRVNLDQEPTADYEWAYKNWNTIFATGKDESILVLEEVSNEPGRQATTIWGKIQGLANQVSTGWQHTMLRIKLLFKIGLLMKLHQDAAPFEAVFPRYACGRKFCITASGYMGWVPLAARTGDLLCYFEDCELPFVIRSCEEGYEIVGDAYVHGFMHVRPPEVDTERQKKIILI